MHIVLVEPSQIGRKILTDILQARDYKVTSFYDGLEAFNFIKRHEDVDVLITSFETPTMGGMELCWEMRLLAEQNRHIYVIAMSSSLETEKVIEALDSGADDFIRKPPVPEELFAKLRAAQRLVTMQQKLLELATRDAMTGLLNRRAFFECSQSVIDNTLTGTPISAIMLDIDHFKSINDTYGHHIGDVAICEVAKLIAQEKGVVGRLGGEEFAIILPIASDAEAAKRAEYLRHNVARMRIEVEDIRLSMTCSFGVAEWLGHDTDTIEDMLRRADDALYEAKNNGRNQVRITAPDLEFMDLECV